MMSVCLVSLGAFLVVCLAVAPAFRNFFAKTGPPLSTATVEALRLTDVVRAVWPVGILAFAGLGVWIGAAVRSGGARPRRSETLFAIAALALAVLSIGCVWLFAGALPFR
jgi:type II secretory pathway component PulF